MQRVRSGRLARVVALFFLLWTGVDLLNPGACAIDQDTQDHSSQAAATALRTDRSHSNPVPSSEDCFCCCQHVEGATSSALDSQGAAAQAFRPALITLVRVFESRLDHPPRLA